MNNLTIEKRQFHNFDTSANGKINFGHLTIPAYQRRYAWREDNIDMVKDELLEKSIDIKNRFENFKSSHGILENILKPYADELIGQKIYFGNIVITLNEDDSCPDSVVDGQQRLSTFALFLKYFELIKEELKSSQLFKENSKAFAPLINKISRALYYQTQDGEERNFVSSENEYDKNYLQEIFSIKKLSEISSKTKNTYLSNLNLIKEKLNSLDPNLKLLILLSLMTSELGITSVVGEERAYELFEALNSRSLQLSPSDLIKNHVFKLTATNANFDPKEKWDSFASNLSKDNKEPKSSDITSFIRAYIIQDTKIYIKKKELFKEFKSVVNKKNIVEYFNKMNEAAKKYVDSCTGAFIHGNDVNIDLKTTFMSVIPKIYAPILLFGELNYDLKLNYKLQQYLFKQSTLHFSINNLPSKELDKNVIEVLNELNNDSKWKEIKLCFDKYFTSETINEIDTYEKRVDRLLNKKFDNRKVLLALYKYMNSFEETEFRTIYKEGTLDLEHILPQTPSKWVGNDKDFSTKEEADKYINLIGNTLFINATINKTISNKDYKSKLNNKGFSWIEDDLGDVIDKSLNDSKLFKKEMIKTFGKIPMQWSKSEIISRTKYIVDEIKNNKILLPE